MLALTDMNGSVVTTVSPQSRLTEGAAISRDGRYVAFDVLKGGDVNVWIADSNGGDFRQLTTGNADQSATFSADGRFVYYQHWSEGCIYTASPSREGRPSRLLTCT